MIQTNRADAQLLATTRATKRSAMPAREAAAASTTSGRIHVARSITARRATIENLLPNSPESGLSSLATPTQPTTSAGSAITMAKNEFQKPSAERSSRRSPSALPIIMRQAPVR